MALDWRSRRTWHPIGYGLTALWMLFVLWLSGGDPGNPAFNFIFIVPIGGWVLGLAIARLIVGRGGPDRMA